MDMSFEQNESPTKLFNQSMFIEETTTTSNRVTNCKLVEIPMVGNKRKTIKTISVDIATTDVVKSVKIRKINDENLEPDVNNVTVLDHVRMSVSNTDYKHKPAVNLNTSRIFDADLSDDNHDASDERMSSKSSPPLTLFNADKSLIATTDMTIDNQSMSSSVSDTGKANVNKTQIYGRGDISAGIDQTFAVRNPLLENNHGEWNEINEPSVSDKNLTKECDTTSNVPTFQSRFGNSRHSLLEDLSIQMDIRFKDRSVSPQHFNTDEQGIEDLTISMETTFKADISDDNDGKTIKKSASDSITEKNSPQSEQQKTHAESVTEPSVTLIDSKKDDTKYSFATENASLLPPINHTQPPSRHNVTNKHSEDMTLCSVVEEVSVTNRDEASSLRSAANGMDLTHVKLSKGALNESFAAQDRAAATDFSFSNSEPLSSTRFVPTNKLSMNFSNSDANVKANSSSVTFNYCQTPTARQSHDLRSVASLHNNTDELCNLEPDQLRKRSDMKKLFLNATLESSNDMLSETKMDLVNLTYDESNVSLSTKTLDERASNRITTDKHADNGANNIDKSSVSSSNAETDVKNETRCRKCSNCRKSMDGNNGTFLKMEHLNQPKLDFSVYNQFNGLASIRDVIEARKKREAVRELQNELLIDQNVEAPDIRFLWENKNQM